MARLIQLKESTTQQKVLLLNEINTTGDSPRTWETLSRVGKYTHPVYGDFEITPTLLDELVENFKKNAYGQKVFIDILHRQDDGAAAEVLGVRREGNRLRVFLEWTELGREYVKKRGMRYLSIEFYENYTPQEYDEQGERRSLGAVLTGGGLVIKPHVKHLDAIDPRALSEAVNDEQALVLVYPALQKKLSEENDMNLSEILAGLKTQLTALKLSERQQKAFVDTFNQNATADDIDRAKSLSESLQEAAKALAEQNLADDKPVTISISATAATPNKTELAEMIAGALKAHNDAAATAKRELEEKLDANQAVFKTVISDCKSLTEADVASLLEEGKYMITPELSEAQVKNLANFMLAQNEKITAARKLSQMGKAIDPMGKLSLDQGAMTLGEQLQAKVNEGLKTTSAYAQGKIKLSEESKRPEIVKQMLAAYDTAHKDKIAAEYKALSEGVKLENTSMPASIERTVILETMEDLRIIELVSTLVDTTRGPVVQIPYEVRDKGPLPNFGRVAQGQGIGFSGVSQKLDNCYLIARKLAMKLSNEVRHFTPGTVNWDAWARNIAANTRLMREELARWITFELQRISDGLNAQTQTDNVAAQLDGSASLIKLSKFPLVPEFQQYDLEGNEIGAIENETVVTVDGTVIKPYPFGDNIASGTYYLVSNYNLGLITLVDETGAAVTPSAATATVKYDYATNVTLIDLDVPTDVEDAVHYNKLIFAVGDAKSRMYQDRAIDCDFLLMAETLNNTCTKAKAFVADGKQAGTDLNGQGDLARIKALPVYRTNTTSVAGEERILMGQRGATNFVVNKPFTASNGELIQCVDANGHPTGEVMTYGEEYSGMRTPKPNRDRYFSIIAYSASQRAAL